MGWDKKQCQVLAKSLGDVSIDGLAAFLKTKKTTRAAADSAFRRYGLNTPASYCAGALDSEQERPSLYREHLRKQAENRLRSEAKSLVSQLEEANARASHYGKISAPREVHAIKPSAPKGRREATALMIASDLHLGERVDAASVGGVNEYNPTIARARMRRLFEGFQWLINHHRNSFAIKDAVIGLIGDVITGFIHDELKESNYMSPVQESLFARDVITEGIEYLLQDKGLSSLTVVCSHGNHGRTTKERQVSTGYANSFEWMLYNVLASQYAANPRVKFIVTPSAHQYLDVYKFGLHFTHGDELRYAGGVGGLTIPLFKRIPAWDRIRKSDYHFIGHFHQYRDFGRAVCNGSLIGYNPYAQSIGADPEPPQQAFALIDSKMGKCMSTPIWVGGDK